jgi:hypothetical protein
MLYICVMKSILFIVFSIFTLNLCSQNNPRIPQRMFNYGSVYGHRNNGAFYSVGYEFNQHYSNSSIELGYRKIMLGLNMISPEKWVLNGEANEVFVSINYVFRGVVNNRFVFVTGTGISTNHLNRYMVKVGTDIEISKPIFLTFNFYQTNIFRFMFGVKVTSF